MSLFNFKAKRKPQLYNRCNTLPIHNFNEVASNNDFSFLKKNPQDVVSDEDLQLAWLDILDEYLRISNNLIVINSLHKKDKIIKLQSRLNVFLAMKYNAEIGVNIDAELKEYKIKKDKIQVNIGMIKNDIGRLSNSIFENEEKNNSDISKHFEDSLALLMEKGYRVDRHIMVVTEWVAALNRIEKQIKVNQQ